jgi:outer membrane protein TolC
MKLKLFFIFLLSGFICSAQDSLINPIDSLISAREAVDIALQNNLRVQIAKSDQDIARINNNWGNAGKWPTVAANINNTFSVSNLNQQLANGSEIKRDGATTNALNANLAATWRIYNGMRVRATKARFEELEKVSDITFKQEITRITYDVLVTYYNLVRLNLQVKATGAIIELAKERQLIAETRFNVGSAAKTDMLQASIDLNAVLVNLENIYRSIKVTKSTLNNLLQRNPDAPLAVSDSTFDIKLVNLAEYKAKIETQNYDLMLAQRDRAILIEDRKIINSQRLPILSLNSVTSYSRSKASGGFFLTNQTFGPNIGIGLAIPIYNSNIFKTQLRVNEAQQKQQQLLTDQLRNELQRDMQIAYEEYDNAIRTSEIERANVKLAEENNFISTERFRKLQGNSIELRQAQESLSNAQDRFIDARFRIVLASTTMQLIAGEVIVN